MDKEKSMSTRCVIYTALAIFLAGCVPSLHELYTEDTVVFDPKLVGCWQAEGAQWCFTRHEDKNAYDLIILESKKQKHSYLLAHLVALDGQRYLDLYPKEEVDLNAGDWYKFHLLPVHTFMKIEPPDPNLALSIMKPDIVQEILKKDPALIRHEIVDDRVVLTASPRELQTFLKNPNIEGRIFEEPIELAPYKPGNQGL
jgi:hypothetical protein